MPTKFTPSEDIQNLALECISDYKDYVGAKLLVSLLASKGTELSLTQSKRTLEALESDGKVKNWPGLGYKLTEFYNADAQAVIEDAQTKIKQL